MYCRGLGLPFPRVEPSPQDQRQPKECHLFSDPTCPEAPVLLHFPLVNASYKDHSAPGEAAPPSITAWQPWALPSPCGQQRGRTWQGPGVCCRCPHPCRCPLFANSRCCCPLCRDPMLLCPPPPPCLASFSSYPWAPQLFCFVWWSSKNPHIQRPPALYPSGSTAAQAPSCWRS